MTKQLATTNKKNYFSFNFNNLIFTKTNIKVILVSYIVWRIRLSDVDLFPTLIK